MDGTTTVPGPGNFMDVHVGDDITGDLVGTVEVDALGNWDLRSGDPQIHPNAATTVTVHSSGRRHCNGPAAGQVIAMMIAQTTT